MGDQRIVTAEQDPLPCPTGHGCRVHRVAVDQRRSGRIKPDPVKKPSRSTVEAVENQTSSEMSENHTKFRALFEHVLKIFRRGEDPARMAPAYHLIGVKQDDQSKFRRQMHGFHPIGISEFPILSRRTKFAQAQKTKLLNPVDRVGALETHLGLNSSKGRETVRMGLHTVSVVAILPIASFLVLPVPTLQNGPINPGSIHLPQEIIDVPPPLE